MKSLIAALTVLWFCLTPSFLPPAELADVVFVNANVYTVNEKQPRAEAIAVKGDRIVFVGSNANAKRFQGGGTRVIDLHGE
ncbi:MAG: amidohydrolase, partial [Acidobacteria bacterium]